MITILVGEKESPCRIHESVLIETSGYFRMSLKGPWTESQGTVTLPELDTGLFGNYLMYAHYDRIGLGIAGQTGELDIGVMYTQLARLYFVADYLQADGLKDIVINAWIDKFTEKQLYCVSLAAEIYSNTTDNSPLRRLYVDIHVWVGKGEAIGSGNTSIIKTETSPDSDGPSEFFIDITRTFAASGAALWDAEEDYPWIKDRCSYHEHADNLVCVRAGKGIPEPPVIQSRHANKKRKRALG